MKLMNFNLFIAAILLISTAGAQNITGVVSAADTKAPIAGATVVAVQRTAAAGERPTILRSTTDSTGHYSIAAEAGQYAICVHLLPQSLYMDPCQWGSPIPTTVGAAAASELPISLEKGARFLVRVHDAKQVLAAADPDAVKGPAITAFVTTPTIKVFPLPVVYSDGNVRDYGTVVPINVPMSVTVSSSRVALADSTGTALSQSPVAVQVLPTDTIVTGAPFSPTTRMFQPADAKIIHVYTATLK